MLFRLLCAPCVAGFLVIAPPAGLPGLPIGPFVEDFFRAEYVTPPALSDDGHEVLFARVAMDGAEIVIRDLRTDSERVVIRDTRPGAIFSMVLWGNPERIVFQLNWGSLYAVNPDGSGRVSLFSSRSSLIIGRMLMFGHFFQPELLSRYDLDPGSVLVTYPGDRGYRDVFKVDINTGKRERHIQNRRKVIEWYADRQGEVRAGRVLNRRALEIVYRAPGESRWRKIDRFVQRGEPVHFRFTGETLAHRHPVLLGFGEEPTELWFASNHESDTKAVYILDLTSGMIRERVAHDPVYDMGILDPRDAVGSFDALRYSRRHGVIGIPYFAEHFRIHWLNEEYSRLQERVDELLEGRVNVIAGTDRDERRFLLFSFSSRNPGSLHVYDRDADSLRSIASLLPGFDEEHLQAQRAVLFKADDGHPVHGYFTPARGFTAHEPPPLVVYVHGGPWVRDNYGYDPTVQYLAHQGFSVLQVNFRGSTGYGYRHVDQVRRDFGLRAVDDLRDGVRWAITEGLARPGAIAVTGFSYGGYATLMSLARYPELFACGISICAPSDLVAYTRHIRRSDNTGLAADHWTEMVGHVWVDRNRLREASPLYNVETIRAPVYLIHGADDLIVPIGESERMHEALRSRGRDVEFTAVENEGHHFSDIRNTVMVYERMIAFLNRHLTP